MHQRLLKFILLIIFQQAYTVYGQVADTCLTTYYKVFNSTHFSEMFGQHFMLAGNRQFINGGINDSISPNYHEIKSVIQLYDQNGFFIKGSYYKVNGEVDGGYAKKMDEHHVALLTSLSINGQSHFCITLIDDDLNLLWTTTLQSPNSYPFYSGTNGIGDFVKDIDGNYFFVANSMGYGEKPRALVVKLGATGSIIWTKCYELDKGMNFMSCATTTGSSLVMVIDGTPKSSVVRIDRISGQMQSAWMFQNNPSGSVFRRLLAYNDGRIFYGADNNQSEFTMGVFDSTGKPLLLKKLAVPASSPRAYTVKDGSLYALYQYQKGVDLRDVLIKVDTALRAQLVNDLPMLRNGHPVGMGIGDDNFIYAAGNYFTNGANSVYVHSTLKKYDPSGQLGSCVHATDIPAIVNLPLGIEPLGFQAAPFTIQQISLPVALVPGFAGQALDEIICSKTYNCTNVQVNGKNAVCGFNNDVTYNAVTNNGCDLNVQWQYDTAFIQRKTVSGNSLVVQYKKAGITWLKAVVNTGCKTIADSIKVAIQAASNSFYLGADTTLCPGTNITLQAPPGYSNYKWQDGSPLSMYLVQNPGIYYVTTQNVCADILSDTIMVRAANLPALHIGNDTAICLKDTLRISASTGFISYSWQPQSLVKGSGSSVYSTPVANSLITATATTSDGCVAYDTLQVIVKQVQQFSLGNDTAFCANSNLLLQAPNSYAKYTWNTGAGSASITVNQPGTYTLTAQDTNGCFAYDTVVVQMEALPVVSLGSDFSLCAGEQRLLNAGNFSGYLWQDGSTGKTFTASLPGLYWVKVSNNNCTATDTVILLRTYQTPGNFLLSTDSICQYEQTTIVASSSFSSYYWTGGSVQSTLVVDKPGRYILQVKDGSGCAGYDTIDVVQKNCYSGVYIPNAFTPNNDGLNDVFRAKLFGNVLSFRMLIYNRFGETVFESTDPLSGWKGDIKGIMQSSGTFVWQCWYEIAGSDPGYKNGTVSLIR